ncbi:ATP-binding protein [Anaerobacillus sp. MEB173]|uniref:ATP-binding protein n=1 Tax=Anaerobacillus sp. MEB173 TaxID=3383345 RepID=UPI003F938560
MNKIENGLMTALGQLPISNSISKLIVCDYCKKEKKQVLRHIPLVGKRWTVNACKCEIDKIDEMRREQKQREKLIRIERALKLSSTNTELRNMTFSNFNVRPGCEQAVTEIKTAVNDFVQRGRLGVFIFGETGNGKSHLTTAGANELIERGYSVIYLTEKDLYSRLQETKRFSNKETLLEIMNACLESDLLIWDDFMSSQRLTDDEKDWTFQIINGRERANKPIWMTSNLTPEEFDHPSTRYRFDNKERTWWRLLGNMNCVYNRATNYRAVQAMERIKGMMRDEV